MAIINSYPTSASGIIVLLKTFPKYRKLDYNKNKRPKNLAYARHFLRAWYNGSYTMMAKPVKSLELHYPMIQFLIIRVINRATVARVMFCLRFIFFSFVGDYIQTSTDDVPQMISSSANYHQPITGHFSALFIIFPLRRVLLS